MSAILALLLLVLTLAENRVTILKIWRAFRQSERDRLTHTKQPERSGRKVD